MVLTWSPDSQLEGFEQRAIALSDAVTYPGEPDGLSATLVRRGPPLRNRAVLYVHGWSDYFFQAHLAEHMESLGYDFYALDLRRYGRSLQEGQLAGFVADLSHYYEEFNEAVRIVRGEGHEGLVVMAHSTGGLVATLWAHDHPGGLSALVLNAPWLDLQRAPMWRTSLVLLVNALSTLSPTAVLPTAVNGFYRRSLHVSTGGAWDYDLNLKGHPAFMVRAGWLDAILAGQARVAAGLAIEAPVLVATSSRSDFRTQWSDDFLRADIVLDVDKLAERSSHLGRHVTLARIPDGIHDLALSAPAARGAYFETVARWLGAYGPEK